MNFLAISPRGNCTWSFVQSFKKDAQEESPIHKIRITLTSRNVKSLEKGLWIISCHRPCRNYILMHTVLYESVELDSPTHVEVKKLLVTEDMKLREIDNCVKIF